jgi:hypothetical protein
VRGQTIVKSFHFGVAGSIERFVGCPESLKLPVTIAKIVFPEA